MGIFEAIGKVTGDYPKPGNGPNAFEQWQADYVAEQHYWGQVRRGVIEVGDPPSVLETTVGRGALTGAGVEVSRSTQANRRSIPSAPEALPVDSRTVDEVADDIPARRAA